MMAAASAVARPFGILPRSYMDLLILLLRINPVYQILIFASFLAFVFPVIGLVMLYRITRPDMGYFRWSWRNPRGIAIAVADIFAVGVSIYIGWVQIGKLFVQR